MKTINVELESKAYPIWIEGGILNRLSDLLSPFNNLQKWILFSQKNIINQYKDLINNLKNDNKIDIEIIQLPEGEDAKSIDQLKKIYSQLIQFGCNRASTFIAFGGGVVGDVTGYVAASFMRGVDYIQIPTSLLAMVDSSIGGKTGVNLPEGKNLVGSIWQPRAVIIDLYLLHSLPNREMISGLGEVIKYGAILDSNLFDLINDNIEDLVKLNNIELLSKVVSRCAELKSEIVSRDERENSRRKILNFGHTIGHGLETYFGFNELRHGEAILYGMLAAGKLSLDYANLDKKKLQKLINLIKKLKLPKLEKYNSNDILEIIKRDKKKISSNISFILLSDIGNTVLHSNISEESIIDVLESL